MKESSLNVSYQKSEVLKNWLNTPVKVRKDLLTYKDSNFIAIVNCINTSLALGANDEIKSTYEVLECIDTYWAEPIYMQIKPNFVKGLRLPNLLQDKYPQFLQGKKSLFLDQKEYTKIFDDRINSWECFQLAMCKIIEQAFLTVHFHRLEVSSDKAALKIIEIDTLEKEKKLRKQKPKIARKEQECIKLEEILPECLEKDKEWCNFENFLVEISSDKSTDIDEKDGSEMMLFDINTIGARSHAIRKYYSSMSIEWDAEVNHILNQAYYELHPFDYLAAYPVVRYYSHPQKYYLQNQ